MILRILLVLEAMTTIVVLHSVARQRMKFDIKTLIIILTNIIFLEIINTYQLNKGFTYITFVPYIIYCMWKFKVSLLKAVKYMIFCLIQVTILQFVWSMVLSFVNIVDSHIVGMWVNLFTLISSILIAMIRRKFHGNSVSKKRNPVVYLAIIFTAIISSAILMQSKVSDEIQAEIFILAVVAVAFMLIFIERYESYQVKCEELEKELETQSDFGESYWDLMKKVRFRQHNINNQIAAIIGTHYTAKTYEELVESQEKYCGEIMQNNKFNRLLWIGNNVLAGFLYKKFTEIESRSYNIFYKVEVQKFTLSIPIQYLIEMLGILLDNAVEALTQNDYEKTIKVNIYEEADSYLFEIINPYKYVSFSEMEEWFLYGKSSKGNERGIGLYRLKEICNERDCEICCSNVEEENVNWIKFGLRVKKNG